MAGTEELAESKKPIILAVVVSGLLGRARRTGKKIFSDKPNHSAEPLTGVEQLSKAKGRCASSPAQMHLYHIRSS